MSGSVSCDEVLEDLQLYLDGELPDTHLDRLRTHLARCYPCADRASFEESLRAIVRRRCHESPPDGLAERIRRRLDTIELSAE